MLYIISCIEMKRKKEMPFVPYFVCLLFLFVSCVRSPTTTDQDCSVVVQKCYYSFLHSKVYVECVFHMS